MEPYILPLSREYYGITSSKRGSCTRQQSAQHHGTLNLFSTDNGYGGGDAATRPHISPAATARTTVGRRYYNSNQESSNTREFPSSGLRHVQVPTAIETPRGIRAVRNAPAARQNIQVVNVTAAYRDPRQMERPKTGLRCHSAFREGSAGVKESLAYRRPYATSSMCSTPLQSARSVSPVVGRAATPQRRVVDYSAQEKFCQAVRDRAQQRCRGVTDFYVQLSRNMVGNSTPNTPRVASTPTLWSLDAPPVAHQLTLARCHDQLVALTAIPISLMEMADMMWDTTEYRRLCDECATAEELAEVEAAMGEAVVSLRDFSAAFGENSSNTRLAVMKV